MAKNKSKKNLKKKKKQTQKKNHNQKNRKSKLNSDIAKFWKPRAPRHGHGCVFNYIGSVHSNDDAHIRIRSNGKTYIIPN